MGATTQRNKFAQLGIRRFADLNLKWCVVSDDQLKLYEIGHRQGFIDIRKGHEIVIMVIIAVLSFRSSSASTGPRGGSFNST